MIPWEKPCQDNFASLGSDAHETRGTTQITKVVRNKFQTQKFMPLVKSGEIGPQTRIWTDGMKDWAPAIDLMPQLFQNTANGTPPPPLPSGGSPPPNTAGQKCHEIDYEIMGGDMQIVEVELDPSETVIAEAGAMNYLEEEITFEAKMGDGSEPQSRHDG